ncbi:MAG TPA: serine/threonine-protein kinase [Holophagaceae bacterium]|nr:serine/threonine-protein kinase [Holophagaceae bacterium]
MSTAFSPPTAIGRYRILRSLGQGGMGMVYLAEDPLLKRRLAIKLVRAFGDARELAMARFRKEAEISAQFNHPNVVTVFDVGVDPERGPWLAMEYVEGQSLAKHLEMRDLDLESKVRVLIQAGRALRAAHRAAIVHRDVKPENILVGPELRTKLMDFGIARSLTQVGHHEARPPVDPDLAVRGLDETQALRLTSTGEFLGSPIYTAPEVLRGNPGNPASDRYSFAATVMEVLTGAVPHPGTTLPGILSHVLGEPPLIPEEVHPPLAEVLRRALATDPDDRQHNLLEFMEEVIDALPAPLALRSRLFASLHQEESSTGTGPGGTPSTRRLTESNPSQPAYAAAKKTPEKILLDDNALEDAAWRTGKVYLPHRGRSEDEGLPWKTIIIWFLALALLIQAYWIMRPSLGLP